MTSICPCPRLQNTHNPLEQGLFLCALCSHSSLLLPFFYPISSSLPLLNHIPHFLISIPSILSHRAMRFASTKHNLLSKNHSSKLTSTHKQGAPPTLSPLDIPELLELIFSFLNDTTINRSVAAVCRHWHHLNQHRLYRDLWWDARWPLAKPVESAVLRIPGANRVRLGGAMRVGSWRQIAHFLAALKKYDRDGQLPQRSSAWKSWLRGRGGGSGTVTQPTLYPHRSVTELEIQCTSLIHREETMDDLGLLTVRFPSTLTSLKIDIRQPFTIQMEYIVEDCPLLETLHIRGESTCRLDGTWVPLNHEPGRSLRLRTLVITNALLDQRSLEDFLRITPSLSTLRLIALVRMVFLDRLMTYDWSRLVELHLQHLDLTSCHFSIKGGLPALDVNTRDRAIDMVPDSTEWCLFPNEITLPLLQELTALPNVVTSLELLSPYLLHPEQGPCDFHGQSVKANLLHDYLCQSPHLIHLKAIRSPVFINNMDICNRSPYGGLDKTARMRLTSQALNRVNTNQQQHSTNVPTVRRPVWKCRGLRTLHLEIHGMALGNNAVNSRIVFGYISVVCPVLEDLVIVANCTRSYFPETGHYHSIPLSLHLDGGLCLLTRLRSLNSLTVIDGMAKQEKLDRSNISDLNWIVPSGRTPVSASMRRTKVATWESWLETEESMELLQSVSLNDDQPVAFLKNSDPLQEIGLLSSVKRVVTEMDRECNSIFPVLHKLSFGYELGMSPEKAVQSYFCNEK